MPNLGYPKSGSEVRSVLADIFRHQGRSEVVELLENAHAYFGEINYDNWNGGTYTWALRLEVPVSVYAAVDSRLTEIEKEILAKLSWFPRQTQSHKGIRRHKPLRQRRARLRQQH